MGVIRRQMSIKPDLQTSALVNYHTQGRPRIGLSFRWEVESVHIGHYYSHLVSKSYDLTLILFHKTAGEESKMIDKNSSDHNVLIKCLRKQHPSPSSPTSSLVQQTCLTPIWRAGTALFLYLFSYILPGWKFSSNTFAPQLESPWQPSQRCTLEPAARRRQSHNTNGENFYFSFFPPWDRQTDRQNINNNVKLQ